MQPIDDPRYQDGQHADHHHFTRFNAGKMDEYEEKTFFHHLDECKNCAKRFADWIRDTKKPGPSR